MEAFSQSTPSSFKNNSKIKLKSISNMENATYNKVKPHSIKKQILIIYSSSNDDPSFQKYCQSLCNHLNYMTCAKYLINSIKQYQNLLEANSKFTYWLLTSQKNFLNHASSIIENIKKFIIFEELSDKSIQNNLKMNQILSKANVADFTSSISLLDSILLRRKLAIRIQNQEQQTKDKSKQNKNTQKEQDNMNLNKGRQVAQNKYKIVKADVMERVEHAYIQNSSFSEYDLNSNEINTPKLLTKTKEEVQNMNQLQCNDNIHNSNDKRDSFSKILSKQLQLVGRGSNKVINLIEYDKYIENGLAVYKKRKSKSIISPQFVNSNIHSNNNSNNKNKYVSPTQFIQTNNISPSFSQLQSTKQNKNIDKKIDINKKIQQNNNESMKQDEKNGYGLNYMNYVGEQQEVSDRKTKEKNIQDLSNNSLNPSKINLGNRIKQDNNMENMLNVPNNSKTQRASEQLRILFNQAVDSQYEHQHLQRPLEQQFNQTTNIKQSLRPKRKSSDKEHFNSGSKISNLSKFSKTARQNAQKQNIQQQNQPFAYTSPSNSKNYANFNKKDKNGQIIKNAKNIQVIPINQKNRDSLSISKTTFDNYKLKSPGMTYIQQNVGIQCNLQSIKQINSELQQKESLIKQYSKVPQATLASYSDYLHLNLNTNKDKDKQKVNRQPFQQLQRRNSFLKYNNYQSPRQQSSNNRNARSYMDFPRSPKLKLVKQIPKTANQYYFKQQMQPTQHLMKSKKLLIPMSMSMSIPISQKINQQSILNTSVNQISIVYLIDRLKKDMLLHQLSKIVCDKDSIYTFKNPEQLYNQIRQSKGVYDFTFVFTEQIIPLNQNQPIFQNYPWCYFVNIDNTLNLGEFAIKHNMIDLRQVSQLSDIIEAIIQARQSKRQSRLLT